MDGLDQFGDQAVAPIWFSWTYSILPSCSTFFFPIFSYTHRTYIGAYTFHTYTYMYINIQLVSLTFFLLDVRVYYRFALVFVSVISCFYVNVFKPKSLKHTIEATPN